MIDVDYEIYSFHSFKGGAGKTTLCLAAALVLDSVPKKTLVLDCDIVGTGLTGLSGLTPGPNVKYLCDDLLLASPDAGRGFNDHLHEKFSNKTLAETTVPFPELGNVHVIPSRKPLAGNAPTSFGVADFYTAPLTYRLAQVIQYFAQQHGIERFLLDCTAFMHSFSEDIFNLVKSFDEDKPLVPVPHDFKPKSGRPVLVLNYSVADAIALNRWRRPKDDDGQSEEANSEKDEADAARDKDAPVREFLVVQKAYSTAAKDVELTIDEDLKLTFYAESMLSFHEGLAKWSTIEVLPAYDLKVRPKTYRKILASWVQGDNRKVIQSLLNPSDASATAE